MKKETKTNLLFLFSVSGALGLGLFWGDIFRSDTAVEKFAIEQSLTKNEQEKNAKKMEYLFSYISENHINAKNLDQQQMWENAFEGLVEGVDDGYTRYYPAIKEEVVEKDTEGSYTGTGVTINKSSGGSSYIENIDENSQANDIGLANGDKILAVNDTDVTQNTLEEITAMIDNESKVKLTIQRGEEVIEKELEKEVIEPPTYVHYQYIDGVNYIKIDSFNEMSFENLKEILSKEVKNKDSLVIDVRDNYGGTLESYEKMMGVFVEKGTPLYSKKTNKETEVIKSTVKKEFTFDKYVLIVNNQTASAAELFTSNMRDLLDAKVVGTKTYGKGSIQSIFNFPDGSYLYITDKEYITSKGEKIDGVGLKPDVEQMDYNLQMSEAIKLAKIE